MAKKWTASALTGGTLGALDAIDGNLLSNEDWAVVTIPGDAVYFYELLDDSGAAESSPDIISPDDNAGDKRWILREIYAKKSGTTEHGEITGTAEIINATTDTEHTGNITTSVTINLAGFTVARPSVKVSLDIASAGGLLTVAILGYNLDWPPNQTQTLTDLVDGKVEAIFTWNKTTGYVVPRVQMTKVA